jgi:hypothetical protein
MVDLETAQAFAKEGRIEEWVHAFLTTEGKNIPLSEGMKRQKRYWIGPVLLPLSRLTRCCGPEEHMKYKTPLEAWKKRTGNMAQSMKTGWNPAPLIVHYEDGSLVLSDGNHRYEALTASDVKEYWTIVWCDTEQDLVSASELLKSVIQ